MLQKYQHPQDPTITKNEDFCGKCTYYSPHIWRRICVFSPHGNNYFARWIFLCIFVAWNRWYSTMPIKTYKTEEQPMPTSSEPETVFGRAAVAQENVPIGVKRERLSVDEYFDELWSMYLTKRENLQNWDWRIGQSRPRRVVRFLSGEHVRRRCMALQRGNAAGDTLAYHLRRPLSCQPLCRCPSHTSSGTAHGVTQQTMGIYLPYWEWHSGDW